MLDNSQLLNLLSAEERARLRTPSEFKAYIEHIYAITATDPDLVEQARLARDLTLNGKPPVRKAYAYLQNELQPISRFLEGELGNSSQKVQVAHLGASDQPDAELFMGKKRVELEVTTADLDTDWQRQMKQLNDIGIANMTEISQEKILKDAEMKIKEAIQRKFHNNKGCWLLVVFNSDFIDTETNHQEQLKQNLTGHKDVWLREFNKIFIISRNGKFFLKME